MAARYLGQMHVRFQAKLLEVGQRLRVVTRNGKIPGVIARKPIVRDPSSSTNPSPRPPPLLREGE